MGYSHFEVRPLAGALGAEITGVNLADLSEAVFAEIRQALVQYSVLCFRKQSLTHEAQVHFGRRFGELDVHPIVQGTDELPELLRVWKPAGESASFGTGWHSDNTFFDKPSMATILYGVTIPPYGGDTVFASMEKAYEALSPAMKEFLKPLKAVHSAARAYDPRVTGEAKYRGEAPLKYKYSEAVTAEVEHPVIRTHPESGRACIFVNPMFTMRIAGLSQRESDAILKLLFEHAVQPELTCRVRWEAHTVAVWDNRCVQHYALDDYRQFERLMYRVTVQGDRPQ